MTHSTMREVCESMCVRDAAFLATRLEFHRAVFGVDGKC